MGNIQLQQVDEATFNNYLDKVTDLLKVWDQLSFVVDEKDPSIRLMIEEDKIRATTPQELVRSIATDDGKGDDNKVVIYKNDMGFLNMTRQIRKNFGTSYADVFDVIKDEMRVYKSIPLSPKDMKQLLGYIMGDSPKQRLRELVILVRIVLTKIDKEKTSEKIREKYNPMFIFLDLGPIDVLQATASLSRIFQIMKQLS